MVFDAVRMRLIEIGEAVKDLPSSLLDSEPELPWPEIAGMRDRLAHRYFDTSHAIVSATVEEDLPDLEQVVQRLKARAAGVELSDDLVVAIDAALGDGPVTKPTLAPLATEGVLHRSA